MSNAYINGRAVIVEAISNTITFEGKRYDSRGTVTINGERLVAYVESKHQPKRTNVCIRCNGLGQYHTYGTCFDCGGSGKKS